MKDANVAKAVRDVGAALVTMATKLASYSADALAA